jgi:hypothetical protein
MVGTAPGAGAFQGAVTPPRIEAVVLVPRSEELGVGVEVFLARVRVRGIHVRGDPVGNRLPLGTVFRPRGERVAEILADHALERLAILGPIQSAEDIVE